MGGGEKRRQVQRKAQIPKIKRHHAGKNGKKAGKSKKVTPKAWQQVQGKEERKSKFSHLSGGKKGLKGDQQLGVGLWEPGSPV